MRLNYFYLSINKVREYITILYFEKSISKLTLSYKKVKEKNINIKLICNIFIFLIHLYQYQIFLSI